MDDGRNFLPNEMTNDSISDPGTRMVFAIASSIQQVCINVCQIP